jgi:hypothetical protein
VAAGARPGGRPGLIARAPRLARSQLGLERIDLRLQALDFPGRAVPAGQRAGGHAEAERQQEAERPENPSHVPRHSTARRRPCNQSFVHDARSPIRSIGPPEPISGSFCRRKWTKRSRMTCFSGAPASWEPSSPERPGALPVHGLSPLAELRHQRHGPLVLDHRPGGRGGACRRPPGGVPAGAVSVCRIECVTSYPSSPSAGMSGYAGRLFDPMASGRIPRASACGARSAAAPRSARSGPCLPGTRHREGPAAGGRHRPGSSR